MNKHTLPVVGASLLLLITSCKKTDVQHENPVSAPTSVSAVTPKAEWTSINNWNSSQGEKFATYSSRVEDSSITTAVAGKGLVLAFSKNGTTINALPFQEKGTTDSYWYYQVSKGAIILSCDNYSGTQSLNTVGFRYFVFSPQQLKDLEAKGHTKIELMQLSYEDLVAVLNK